MHISRLMIKVPGMYNSVLEKASLVVRCHTADTIGTAGFGHPGLPLHRHFYLTAYNLGIEVLQYIRKRVSVCLVTVGRAAGLTGFCFKAVEGK